MKVDKMGLINSSSQFDRFLYPCNNFSTRILYGDSHQTGISSKFWLKFDKNSGLFYDYRFLRLYC
jgi:hypothetical protein